MKLFEKILIANRGEIAARIIRTAKKLGIKTVTVFSDADKDSLYIKMSDESFYLGEDNILTTYLNIEKIISIAKTSGVSAIHPGYGFLAENPEFAKACKESDIIFIGPDENVIKLMGNKIEAGNFVKSIDIPMIKNAIGDISELTEAANEIGFPILVKAAAGGGGKGMRIVRNKDDLSQALETTAREALSYFGNSDIFIEKYVENPRHIEVQLLGDNYGNIIHLYERECSIQRRYQKIIEEAPSITLNDEVRNRICETAVKIGKETSYNNAGTIEFLVDKDLNYYFLEMNTRIQVEHPVTELITGVDIVEEQIKISAGNKLSVKQDDIQINGHAIECRIYAEDPYDNFLPSPGEISFYKEPNGKNIRVDSSISKEETIHSFFDPMISKLIVWNNNRENAIKMLSDSLQSYLVHGIKTNIRFLKKLLNSSDFQRNHIHTAFCDKNLDSIIAEKDNLKEQIDINPASIAYILHELNYKPEAKNIWTEIGFWRHLHEKNLIVNETECLVEIIEMLDNKNVFKINDNVFKTKTLSVDKNCIRFFCNGKNLIGYISRKGTGMSTVSINDFDYNISYKYFLSKNVYDIKSDNKSGGDNDIFSPMPGKVLKVNVKTGDIVNKNQILLIVEAMKMENNLVAARKGKVKEVMVKENEMVDANSTLILLEDI